MANKWVYMFSEGDMTMRNLLGGKGANLAEMTSIGLPVPQGFTITTEACTQYYEDGRKINDEIMAQATVKYDIIGMCMKVGRCPCGFDALFYCVFQNDVQYFTHSR